MLKKILCLLLIVQCTALIAKDSFFLQSPQETLSQLSLRQKIGQLIVVAAVSDFESNQKVIQYWKQWQPLYQLDPDYIEHLISTHEIGGVIFYGLYTRPEQQVALTRHFQSISPLPLFICMDAERGLCDRLDKELVIRFPQAMTLGAIGDSQLIYQAGVMNAKQLLLLEVHMGFSPVVDVNYNPKNPIIGPRSFSSDPDRVALYGTLFMHGLQDTGIIGCAKHFPGHGDTDADSHEELPLISHNRTRLQAIELKPFDALIQAGVQSIMLAHLAIPALTNDPALPSCLCPAVVTDLLQTDMDFKGLVITDALGMKGVSEYAQPGELEVLALLAGADILLCPMDPVAALDAIEHAVITERISQKEIDRKVLKVLTAKKEHIPSIQTHNDVQELCSQQAKDLKKLLYTKAITWAKRSDSSSFTPNTHVLCITKETSTPFATLMQSYGFCTKNISPKMSCDQMDTVLAEIPQEASIIMSIQSMNPSAKNDFGVSQSTLHAITKIKESGKQLTLILFGSPYSIPLVDKADAILVAYEDDPDAQEAAAHVIAGTLQAEGILPVNPYM